MLFSYLTFRNGRVTHVLASDNARIKRADTSHIDLRIMQNPAAVNMLVVCLKNNQ